MFSSFLSMTSSCFKFIWHYILKIIASVGALKCVFSWGIVIICLICFFYFLVKCKFKRAIAVFILLGAATYAYDLVGCNDCGSKLFLSHHFGSTCPFVETVPDETTPATEEAAVQENKDGDSEKQSAPDVCRDTKDGGDSGCK